MKQKSNYIIRFNELSESKQSEIQNNLKKIIMEDREIMDRLASNGGADPFDMDRPDSDRMLDNIDGAIDRACSRSWVEWQIELII